MTSYSKKRPLGAVVLSSALMGLVPALAEADPAKVKAVEEKPLIVFTEGAAGRPSLLKKARTRFDTPPTKIGELQRGWLCGKTGDIHWNAKLYNTLVPRFSAVYRKELEKANYPVPKVSTALFEQPTDTARSSNDLQVGVMITDEAANFCLKSDGILGGVYLKVLWQVFAPEAQKVVFETTTEGAYQTETPEKTMPDGFFAKAFAAATRNLLAEQGFHAAVSNTSPIAASSTSFATLKLKAEPPQDEPLANKITSLRAAVATVFADSTSGTGFFVSSDGHLLTNHHVVGNAKFVKLKLPTGRELLGEVLRADKVRDVALIKTEPSGVKPMSLRSTEPNVGEDVFAIGSPLGDRFNTTLTKGILSGYRNIDDKRYLQSDVAILPGNSGGPLLDASGSVLGITVAGLGAKGLSGMNFFIPINDALGKLGIEFE